MTSKSNPYNDLKTAVRDNNTQKTRSILEEYDIDGSHNDFELIVLAVKADSPDSLNVILQDENFLKDVDAASATSLSRCLQNIYNHLDKKANNNTNDNENTLVNVRGRGSRGGGRGFRGGGRGFRGGGYGGYGRGGYGLPLAAGLGTAFLLSSLAYPRYYYPPYAYYPPPPYYY